MADVNNQAVPDQSGQREHVTQAFELWKQTQGDRVSKEDELRLHNIRDAAHRGDSEKLREHLDDAKTHSNWLYDELVKHPQIASIFRELSIMGF